MAGCAKGQQDLVDLIDWKSVEVLNQSSEHTWENALKKGYRESDSVYLESDCDEQILLHIPFSQQVKIHSFALHHSERDFAPSGVKLFVNQPTIGFDEAEDFEGTQTIDLSEADVLEGNAGRCLSPLQLRARPLTQPTRTGTYSLTLPSSPLTSYVFSFVVVPVLISSTHTHKNTRLGIGKYIKQLPSSSSSSRR